MGSFPSCISFYAGDSACRYLSVNQSFIGLCCLDLGVAICVLATSYLRYMCILNWHLAIWHLTFSKYRYRSRFRSKSRFRSRSIEIHRFRSRFRSRSRSRSRFRSRFIEIYRYRSRFRSKSSIRSRDSDPDPDSDPDSDPDP